MLRANAPQGPGWYWFMIFQILRAGGVTPASQESSACVPDQDMDAQ